MIQAGGENPSVRGQPPQRRTQYSLPAASNAIRASCSLRRCMITTFSGSASLITVRSNFPRAHFIQYGFAIPEDPHTTRAPGVSNLHNRNERKGEFPICAGERGEQTVRFAAEIRQLGRSALPTRRPRSSPVSVVGPAVVATPLRLDSGRPTPIPHSRNAPLSERALCCSISVLPRQTPQRPRRDFVLGERRRFAAVRASFPFAATDLHPPSKARIDHVAHSSRSYPVAALVERHPVQQQ